jgi:hypothetical protein
MADTFRPQQPAMDPDGLQITGNVPPGVAEALQASQQRNQPETAAGTPNGPSQPPPQMEAAPEPTPEQPPQMPQQMPHMSMAPPSQVQMLIDKLPRQYEEVKLPSLGKFYSGNKALESGVLHLRKMTGEEEEILATPHIVKKNEAIDVIFRKCIQEDVPTEELLTVDRTYLLIYLRGRSISPKYEVEVKCPSCDARFETEINLGQLDVEYCPDDAITSQLCGTLPESGYKFSYRFSRGKDDMLVNSHREQRVSQFGSQATDDTLSYRTAILLEEIEGVTDTRDLQLLLRRLSMGDVAHLRSCITDPPFGVDTNITIVCPVCTETFKLDLPLEASFFFPRSKRKEPDR